MRTPYVTRSFVLALLIALGAALPKAPDAGSQRDAKMRLVVSPVEVTELDML